MLPYNGTMTARRVVGTLFMIASVVVGVLALKVKGSDGVRSVYDRFKGVGGVNEQTAPHLFAYLAEEKELSLRL